MIKKTKKSEFMEIRVPRLKFGSASLNGYLITTLILFAFFLGMLTNKVLFQEKELKLAKETTVTQAATAKAPIPQAAPTEDTTPKKISVDNDPVLGSANAKVTLIEFSDYECPFCKRYFDDTYLQIKKTYIDPGLIKIVYRDLPLPFHQNAHKEAEAAECAREQGGDSIYFQYHDLLFTRTTSNGTGLSLDQLAPIAGELGLNAQAVQSCMDSNKYKSEVDKDITDANKAGGNGTPTFFIGKSTSSGVITGTKLVGAQPFASFQRVIDQELKK